jgi:hypothetical protein
MMAGLREAINQKEEQPKPGQDPEVKVAKKKKKRQ